MCFDFKDVSLTEAVHVFHIKTSEIFVLAPLDRKTGRLDPKTLVSGSVKEIPF